MKKFILFSIVLLLLQSCFIHINESGYRSLNYVKNLHIKSLEAINNIDSFNTENNKNIYKVNTENIFDIANNHEYTWVHIWNPYCPNDNCVNIGQFEELADHYKSKGLKLVFTSTSYDLKKIFTIADNSSFRKPIYVLDGEYYGVKLKKIRQKLYMDLNKEAKEDDVFFHDDYVFKGDSLIYFGSNITDSIMDKLILEDKIQL